MSKSNWIACHDTMVCAGAKQIQKWCVRVGDKKGPLVAVMLTKDVAHALAAAPDLLAVLHRMIRDFETDGVAAAMATLNTHGRVAIAKAEGTP